MSQLPVSTPEAEPSCANCAAVLTGTHCVHCGQHRRESKRLEVRQIIARFFENLYDFDSAFLRTWLGLTRHPGLVCLEYVQGRRKTYMNPFGYFVLAITVTVVVSAISTKLFPSPAGAAANDDSDFISMVMLLSLVPLAVIWSKLFRREGFNLAENYVFALYILGHFIWIELLILVPASFVSNSIVLTILYGLTSAVYVTVAAKAFYRESVGKVLLKLFLSVIVMGAVVMVVSALAILTGILHVED